MITNRQEKIRFITECLRADNNNFLDSVLQCFDASNPATRGTYTSFTGDLNFNSLLKFVGGKIKLNGKYLFFFYDQDQTFGHAESAHLGTISVEFLPILEDFDFLTVNYNANLLLGPSIRTIKFMEETLSNYENDVFNTQLLNFSSGAIELDFPIETECYGIYMRPVGTPSVGLYRVIMGSNGYDKGFALKCN